jgi:hypothetical protein
MPRAADFWSYYPAAGRAPELEEDMAPAFVVEFDDGFDPPPRRGLPDAAGQARPKLNGVVCVVPRSGFPHLYYDISFEGAKRPAQ